MAVSESPLSQHDMLQINMWNYIPCLSCSTITQIWFIFIRLGNSCQLHGCLSLAQFFFFVIMYYVVWCKKKVVCTYLEHYFWWNLVKILSNSVRDFQLFPQIWLKLIQNSKSPTTKKPQTQFKIHQINCLTIRFIQI